MLEAGESVAMEQRQCPLARLAQRNALDFHAENGVVEHGSPRQQKILLQHVADAADRAGGVAAIAHPAAGARLEQPGDDVENGALAAPRWPDQADETALRDRQRDRGQRLEDAGRRLERHADAINVKLRGRRRHAHSAHQWHDFPSPRDYIAKGMPATIVVYFCKRREIEVPSRLAVTANYSICPKFWQGRTRWKPARAASLRLDVGRFQDR